MATKTFQPRQSEFSCRFPDNLLLVENVPHGVIIRAARNNFSEQRKTMFVRELAAEGFIPDEYEFFADLDGMPGVEWVIDNSWIEIPTVVAPTANRWCIGLFLGAALLGILLLVWFFIAYPSP